MIVHCLGLRYQFYLPIIKAIALFFKWVCWFILRNINTFIKSAISNIPDNIENIVLEDREARMYYGSDFSGFYVDYKTGEIGLKVFSSRGLFQGGVDEQVLYNKGFVKYII